MTLPDKYKHLLDGKIHSKSVDDEDGEECISKQMLVQLRGGASVVVEKIYHQEIETEFMSDKQLEAARPTLVTVDVLYRSQPLQYWGKDD